MATVGDLTRFWRALFSGEVFTQKTTIDTLLTTTIESEVPGYRMGVFVRDYNGLTAYEHSGFWGTIAVYVPKLDLTIAAAVTQQEQGRAVFKLARDTVEFIRIAMQEH